MPLINDPVVFSIILLLILAVSVWLARWFFSRSRRDHIRNRTITQALDAIRLAAEETHRRGINAPDIDLTDSFTQLNQLAEECPEEVIANVVALEKVWGDVLEELQKFKDESTRETMQSSILTNRTNRMMTEINNLAKMIEAQLGDTSQRS